jgi:hypothetical protein
MCEQLKTVETPLMNSELRVISVAVDELIEDAAILGLKSLTLSLYLSNFRNDCIKVLMVHI